MILVLLTRIFFNPKKKMGNRRLFEKKRRNGAENAEKKWEKKIKGERVMAEERSWFIYKYLFIDLFIYLSIGGWIYKKVSSYD